MTLRLVVSQPRSVAGSSADLDRAIQIARAQIAALARIFPRSLLDPDVVEAVVRMEDLALAGLDVAVKARARRPR